MQTSKLDIYDKAILRYLLAHKDRWITVNSISKATKFSWITVDNHLKKLERMGVLEIKEHGKKRKYKENS